MTATVPLGMFPSFDLDNGGLGGIVAANDLAGNPDSGGQDNEHDKNQPEAASSDT